ncbi:AraC family transcriptional regulator [Fulvivirgaceae bacterium BMA10]|uniref:AraC family transcriptional regulator n=1 Tax=Splendidivirga corallicola TaxID=3051826 RepID=A0ABT8KXI6_9BACT|nr:AraC family transcriptional regulator [Fulvivirgaceae bacterium BMA10]
MKLQLLDRKTHLNKSFTISRHRYPHFLKLWHYHPELELIFTTKSTGTRFIGDSIEKFEPNDLVLIGENLPHLWMNDKQYFEKGSKRTAEAIVVHFGSEFAGQGFFEMPEMRPIKDLLQKAKRGIRFTGSKKPAVVKRMKKMLEQDDFNNVLELLRVLKVLSEELDHTLLTSIGFLDTFQKTQNRKLDSIYEYIMNNFRHEISLDEIAEIANMNKTAFCRYFKKVNDRTLSQYVNEVRIGWACKLLLENKYNISQICYECGFNNISNFNRQFRNITKLSPSEYLNEHGRV